MNKKNINLCYTDLTLRAQELKSQNWKITIFSILVFGLIIGLDAASIITGIDPEKINFYRFILVLVLVLTMEFGVNILMISTSEIIRVKRRILICRNLFDEEVLELLDDNKDHEKWYNQYNILFQIISIIIMATLVLLYLFGTFN
jgi:hypothetical protein